MLSNAIVFIKPDAVTAPVKALVKEKFDAVGLTVAEEGAITAEDIDKKGLIDSHYGSIAARAMSQQPSELAVQPKAQEEFAKVFGVQWSEAVSKGWVRNAADAAQHLKLKPMDLAARFDELKRGVDQIKLGGGFYVGKLSDTCYVVNGFYFRMRQQFVEPGTSIYYYVVTWDPAQLSWGDFRGKVLGATDPSAAAEGSLRNTLLQRWKELGIKTEPNMGSNGVHASASPLEALAEKRNWLGAPPTDDPFGQELLTRVPPEMLDAWLLDPVMRYEGKDQSVFDLFEDVDPAPALQIAKKLLG